jgi:hypothetical protein
VASDDGFSAYSVKGICFIFTNQLSLTAQLLFNFGTTEIKQVKVRHGIFIQATNVKFSISWELCV